MDYPAFNVNELYELEKLLKTFPPFSTSKKENVKLEYSQDCCLDLKDLLQRECWNMELDYLNAYVNLLNEKSEQIRYLNDCRKCYENLCRQKARDILKECDIDDEDESTKKIKEWATSRKNYIHKTRNCYIDYVFWRENISELQIRIVNRKHKELEIIEHLEYSFRFQESGNTYTVVKKKYKGEELRRTDFIVSELLKFLKG